jgi:hypothetical protein
MSLYQRFVLLFTGECWQSITGLNRRVDGRPCRCLTFRERISEFFA